MRKLSRDGEIWRGILAQWKAEREAREGERMKVYSVQVTETQTRLALYTIEAESETEALEKAMAGITAAKDYLDSGEVIRREVADWSLELEGESEGA